MEAALGPTTLGPSLGGGHSASIEPARSKFVDNHGAKIGEYGNASNMTKSHLEQHQEKDKGRNFEQRFQSATAI